MNEAKIGMEKYKSSQIKIHKEERDHTAEKKMPSPLEKKKEEAETSKAKEAYEERKARGQKTKRKEVHLQIDKIRDQTINRRARKLTKKNQKKMRRLNKKIFML